MPKITTGDRAAYEASRTPRPGEIPNKFQEKFKTYRQIRELVNDMFVRGDELHGLLDATPGKLSYSVYTADKDLKADLPFITNKRLPSYLHRRHTESYSVPSKTMVELISYWRKNTKLQESAKARVYSNMSYAFIISTLSVCTSMTAILIGASAKSFDLPILDAGLAAVLMLWGGYDYLQTTRTAREASCQADAAAKLGVRVEQLQWLLYGLDRARGELLPLELAEKEKYGLISPEDLESLRRQWWQVADPEPAATDLNARMDKLANGYKYALSSAKDAGAYLRVMR